MACVMRAGTAGAWIAAVVCAFDCAPARGAPKNSSVKETKSKVRSSKDWSFIVRPLCGFEPTCKTFPAGESPGSQSTILRVAELRGLRSETGTTHRLALRAYHKSWKHYAALSGDLPGSISSTPADLRPLVAQRQANSVILSPMRFGRFQMLRVLRKWAAFVA